MIIYGPKNANYDIDLGPVFITDWYHREYFDIVEEVMQPGGSPRPASDNNLISGKMNFDCSTKAAGDNAKYVHQERRNFQIQVHNWKDSQIALDQCRIRSLAAIRY